MDLLACTAPEILITRAAAATKRIRVGSGGIMLPHYSPLKVAEVFRTLHAMFPNRIDLGVGRAPGGGQLEAHALKRDRTSPHRDDFLQQLAELRAFLGLTSWPHDHAFSRIRVAPEMPGAPELWLLGSSMWSSRDGRAGEPAVCLRAFLLRAGHTRSHHALPAQLPTLCNDDPNLKPPSR